MAVNETSSSDIKDARETLLLNISQYKSQLDEVSTALDCASEENKAQLQELQLNLISILELTLSQLDHSLQSNTTQPNPSESDEERSSSNQIDKEFEKFKQEISELNENEIEDEDEEAIEEPPSGLKEFESSFRALEGQSVRIPFMERWGGHSYHNAIILSVVLEEHTVGAYDNPHVMALYSQPTYPSMLPCRFFLDGRCKFDSETCKFSHGKKVAVEDLKEYREPDREKIVSGSSVLILHDEQDLWHRGKVEDILEDRSGSSVNCSTCATVYEVPLESMFPLFADDEEETSKETSKCEKNKDDETSIEDEAEQNFVPTEVWLQNTLNSKLGEWEKYTKGIGSKLMAKMGYIVGTGLGRNGEGRVDPVSAYLYPQGKSLDHCMRLREASNGEALWEVEKRLLGDQRREEQKQKQQQKRLHAKTSVFDIINNKLGSKTPSGNSLVDDQSGNSQASIDVTKSVLKKNTTKELNRKNFQLSSNMDKLREEVKSLKQSRERQSKDAATVKAIDLKVHEKMQQLSALEKAAEHITYEQQSRRNMKKLCTF